MVGGFTREYGDLGKTERGVRPDYMSHEADGGKGEDLELKRERESSGRKG